MIASGEDHSATSKQVYRDAQDALTELEKQLDLPDTVLDCYAIIKRLETENAELTKLLSECFENAIAPLGADITIKPDATSEDLANRVFQVLKGK